MTKNRLRGIQLAVLTYEMQFNFRPASITDIGGDKNRLPPDDTNDSWGKPLRLSSINGSLFVSSDGADGLVGTSDDLWLDIFAGDLFRGQFPYARNQIASLGNPRVGGTNPRTQTD